MKIAFIRQRFAAFGGAERYMNLLIGQLAQRGHEIHILANQWEEIGGTEKVVWHHVPMIRAFSFLRALSFAKNCQKLVRQSDFDLVVSLDRTLEQDIYRSADGCHRAFFAQRLRYAAPFRRLRLWLNPLHYVLLWLERRTYSPKNTRAVVALSHRIKKEIVHYYDYPSEKIHVIHNGVETDRFALNVPKQNADKFILLFAGSGFERKGLEFCVRALSRLPKNVELWVVGKGKTQFYLRLAEKLKVADRIVFKGPIQNMERIYPDVDILVHPAIYEPFGNVVLEAMACGIPVVASEFVGASEIIVPKKNGIVVKHPGQATELANAIQSLLDRKVLSGMAPSARATAEAHSITRYVDQFWQVMEKLSLE